MGGVEINFEGIFQYRKLHIRADVEIYFDGIFQDRISHREGQLKRMLLIANARTSFQRIISI